MKENEEFSKETSAQRGVSNGTAYEQLVEGYVKHRLSKQGYGTISPPASVLVEEQEKGWAQKDIDFLFSATGPTPEDCPECDGLGTLLGSDEDDGGITRYFRDPCPSCSGDGKARGQLLVVDALIEAGVLAQEGWRVSDHDRPRSWLDMSFRPEYASFGVYEPVYRVLAPNQEAQ